MDIQKLLKALDDESNETLMNFTSDKIKEMNLNVLKELHLPRKDTLELMSKLKDYKYVDEMNEIRQGSFIRWIPISDPENIHLSSGGMVCGIKITDAGLYIICKNFAKKHYQLKFYLIEEHSYT